MRPFLPLLLCLAATSAAAVCFPADTTVVGEYERSDAVVRATVVAVQAEVDPAEPGFTAGHAYTLRVDESFRDKDVWGLVPVYDENDSGRFPLEPGLEYVLFLVQGPKGYVVDACGNSALASERTALLPDLRALAKHPPAPVATAGDDVELYAWQEERGGEWRYAVFPASRALRSGEDVHARRLPTLAALEEALGTRPPGGHVVLLLRRETAFPDPALVNDIAAFARARGQRFDVDMERGW
jgi:hypothetical protein